jgi:hypothetical protein
MSALLFAIALFATQDAANAAPASAPAAAEAPADGGPAYPIGAPRDDYGLVSWCYGALRGYLDLHDQVMPEVRRIETTYRRPGSNLADDLKVYDVMQREGRKDLTLFESAIETAERASIKPIAPIGAAAVTRGRATWAAAPTMPPARVAQEWMSWTLPARCEITAQSLQRRAKLMGSAFQVNSDIPPEPEAPAVEAPVEPAPNS